MGKVKLDSLVQIVAQYPFQFSLGDVVEAVGFENVDFGIVCNSAEEAAIAHNKAWKDGLEERGAEKREYFHVLQNLIETCLWIPLSEKEVAEASNPAEAKEAHKHANSKVRERAFSRWLELCKTGKDAQTMFEALWPAAYGSSSNARNKKKTGSFLRLIERWNELTLEEIYLAQCLDDARRAFHGSSRFYVAVDDPEEVKNGAKEAYAKWNEYAMTEVQAANGAEAIVDAHNRAPEKSEARREALRRLVTLHTVTD